MLAVLIRQLSIDEIPLGLECAPEDCISGLLGGHGGATASEGVRNVAAAGPAVPPSAEKLVSSKQRPAGREHRQSAIAIEPQSL
jgi:hypothetical protein